MFYNYPDTLPLFHRLMPNTTREQMYALVMTILDDPGVTQGDTIGIAHLDWERHWHMAERPFYRLWPKIIPMLLRLDLSAVPASACKLPNGLTHLLVQMPKGNGLCDDGTDLQTIIVGDVTTRVGPGIAVGGMDGKTQRTGQIDVPLVDMWVFPHTDQPLVEVLDALRIAAPLQASLTLRDKVISLVTTLCLLDSDPGLLTPVLLSNDVRKAITQADIDRLADKARRRGRYGWDIGKGVEVMPHYRRPHTALMWTGSGRKVPKVVLRKGSLVHRSKIENIPTGYLDDTAR
jgi:hypothetical protein